MSASSRKNSKKRGILSLTRLVRDAFPEQMKPVTDDDPTDQLPALRVAPGSADGASGEPADPVQDAPAQAQAPADEADGLRRLAAQSRVPLGDYSPNERASAVRRLEEEIHQRLARWVRLEDELRTRTAEIDRLQSELTTSKTTISTLEVLVRSLTTERDDTRREVVELRTDLANERRVSGTSVEQQRALEAEAKRLAAATEDKDRRLREAEARVEALTAELAGHRDALVGLEGSLTDQQATFERQEQEKAALADTIRGLEKKLEESRAQLRAESSALTQLRADNEARTRATDTTAKELAAAQAEQRRLELAYQEERRKAEGLRDDAHKWEKAATKADVNRRKLEEQLQTLEAGTRDRDGKVQELESAVAGLMAERERLSATLEKRESELAQRQEEVAELERVGGALTVERDAQLRTIDELHNQMRSQKKLVSVLSQGVGNVDEVAATVASLDAWVSQQVGGDERHQDTATFDAEPGVRLMESMDGSGSVRYPLSKHVFTIGRAHDSDLRVGGKYTSRHHARILNEENEVVIEDLGSANGIMVNESLVARSVLHDGDVVEIGGSRFRFVDPSERANLMRG